LIKAQANGEPFVSAEAKPQVVISSVLANQGCVGDEFDMVMIVYSI
jgi:hypothetical protein